MAEQPRPIDISRIPDLLRIAREVRETGEARVLETKGEELAILTPVKKRAKRSSAPRKTGIITKDDPLWNIIGMAESAGPTDVAKHKHEYLAEAYADLHE